MAPEGILERWRAPAGSHVALGGVVAEISIGESLHELLSPGAGRLRAFADRGDVVEPGTIVGEVEDSP